MTALLTSTFRGGVAKSILSDIQYGKSKYFHFIGKVATWGTGDLAPAAILDTQNSAYAIRDELVVAKRVDATDVSLVVDRVNWASGTVYTMWDSSLDLSSANFYVLTSDFRVYKCLDNNLGAPSTVMPTSTSVEAQTLADHYIWKYLYTIGATNRAKFLSLTHMPVQRAVSDRFYNNGSISSAVLVTGGTGYISNNPTSLHAAGGSGTAILVPSISSTGVVKAVTVTNGGTGYVDNCAVTITGTGTGDYGATATFRAYVSAGVIVHVDVIDGGHGYATSDGATISIQGDGTGAAMTPVVYGGSVVDIIVDSYGIGYTYANININAVVGSGASARAVLETSDFISDQSAVEQWASDHTSGAIHAIVLSSGGGSYTSATVNITGDGSGATATATIVDGSITKINVTNIGSGYSYATINITGDNITNNPLATSAVAYPVYSPEGGHGKDAPNELYAKTLAVFSNLRGSLDATIQQDFRQYGLISGLKDLVTGADITTKSTVIGYMTTTFNTSASLVKDEVLVGSTGRFRVLSFSGTSVNLVPLTNPNITPVGTLSAETNLGRTYQCTSKNSSPDFNKYSGNVLYYSDDPAFSYSDEQSVIIKTFIRF